MSLLPQDGVEKNSNEQFQEMEAPDNRKILPGDLKMALEKQKADKLKT
jgi:hypothetical protein